MDTIAQSERLSLRVPSMDDLDAMAALWADPETMRYIGKGGVWTRDEVAARLERGARQHAERGLCFWTVVRNADGAVMGQGGVVPIAFNGPEFELGYRLGRAYWGRGYATEAARLAAGYAFGVAGLERLVAVAYPENAASLGVLAKAGFRATGESDLYYGVHALTFAMDRAGWAAAGGV